MRRHKLFYPEVAGPHEYGSRQQHLTAVMLDFTKRCNYCVDLHNARTMLRSCIITEESAQLPG